MIGGIPAGGLNSAPPSTPRRSSVSPASSTSTTAAAALTSPFSAWLRPDRQGNLNVSNLGRGWRAGTHQRFPEYQRSSSSWAPSPPVTGKSPSGRRTQDSPGRQGKNSSGSRTPSAVPRRPSGGGDLRHRALEMSSGSVPGPGDSSRSPRHRPQRDILDKMDFAPVIKAPPALHGCPHFRRQPMGIRNQCWKSPWPNVCPDPGRNLFSSISKGWRWTARTTSPASGRPSKAKLAPVVQGQEPSSVRPLHHPLPAVDDYIAMVRA